MTTFNLNFLPVQMFPLITFLSHSGGDSTGDVANSSVCTFSDVSPAAVSSTADAYSACDWLKVLALVTIVANSVLLLVESYALHVSIDNETEKKRVWLSLTCFGLGAVFGFIAAIIWSVVYGILLYRFPTDLSVTETMLALAVVGCCFLECALQVGLRVRRFLGEKEECMLMR